MSQRRMRSASLRVLLGGTLLLVFALVAAALVGTLVAQVQERLAQEMSLRGELMLTGLREALSNTVAPDAPSTVSAFAAEPDVRLLLVIGDDGVVIASTRASLIGASVERVLSPARARAVREVHRRMSQKASFELTEDGYESLLPIEMQPEPGGVQHRRAALLVQLDSERAAHELWAWARRSAAAIAAALLLVAISIYLLLHWLVLAPIAHLERTIDARRHDEEARANEDAPGEFAALARNFNALQRQTRLQREALAAGAASLRESRARYQELATASPMGILVHRDGVPVFANDAAAHALGFDDGPALCAVPHIEALFDLQDDQFGRARLGMFGSVSAHKPWQVTGRARDGRQPRVEVRARSLSWEGDEAVLLQFADISDRHAAQLAMRRARDEAVGMARLRSAFLANMSHELRTPLNGVLGMLALLRDTRLDVEQGELIEGAHRSGEALLERVNDILEFSRIEAGGVQLEPAAVDLRDLIDDALEMQLANVARKGIDIGCLVRLPEPCIVEVDPGRLRQVLVNLVSNAVKFTDAGHVVVEVYVDDAQAQGEWLRLDVRDTGRGIPTDAIERIFVPFMQADVSTTRRFGGSGLGLSISRRLLQLMHGDVVAASSGIDGEGSVFSVRLPLGVLRSQAALGTATAISAAVDDAGPLACICSAAPLRSRWLANALTALGWRSRLVPCDPQPASGEALGCAVLIVDEDLPGATVDALVVAARAMPEPPRILLWSAFAGAGGEGALTPMQAARFDGVLRRLLRLDILQARLDGAGAMSRGDRPAGPDVGSVAQDAQDTGRSWTARPAAVPGSGYGRVLVVDDVELNREVLRRMFVRLGFIAETANDGVEALAAIAAAEFDLVMMDGQMPLMDGFEATARIRALPAPRCDLHIVAVTANAMAGDEERCLAAGMDDYLSKPVTLRALRDAVDRWLMRERDSHLAAGRPAMLARAPTAH